VIQSRWNDLLRNLTDMQAAVMQFYRVQKVDGNVVYLCTDNRTHFERMNGHTDKLRVLEKAISKLHQARLRVRVVLVDSFDGLGSIEKPARQLPDDPLFSAAMQLGAEIHEDKPDREK
jgi:hypothetical protein